MDSDPVSYKKLIFKILNLHSYKGINYDNILATRKWKTYSL